MSKNINNLITETANQVVIETDKYLLRNSKRIAAENVLRGFYDKIIELDAATQPTPTPTPETK